MSKRGHIDLIRIFFFDEADRMLDMGFFPDVLWIVEKMTGRRQTLLFSATFPQEVLFATEEFTNDPVHVMSQDLEVEVPETDQFVIKVGRLNKMWALGRIFANMSEGDQMLIFTNTKRMVDMLDARLDRQGVDSAALHGDTAQNKRERILDSFREGKKSILVATDEAARGWTLMESRTWSTTTFPMRRSRTSTGSVAPEEWAGVDRPGASWGERKCRNSTRSRTHGG